MLLTIIKIITLLYPFLNELFLGKHSHKSKKRVTKRLFIFIFLISITVNMYGGKKLLTITKELADAVKEKNILIADNNKLIKQKNKIEYVNVEKEVIKNIPTICKVTSTNKKVYKYKPKEEIDPSIKEFIRNEMENLSKLEE